MILNIFSLQPFVHCCVGHPVARSPLDVCDNASAVPESKSRLSSLMSFRLPIPNPIKGSSSQSPEVVTMNLGTQDDHFGMPVCFRGQLGSVCVFAEALQPSQVKSLYTYGK